MLLDRSEINYLGEVPQHGPTTMLELTYSLAVHAKLVLHRKCKMDDAAAWAILIALLVLAAAVAFWPITLAIAAGWAIIHFSQKEQKRRALIEAEEDKKRQLEAKRIQEENNKLAEENKKVERRKALRKQMTHTINCPKCDGSGICYSVRTILVHSDGSREDPDPRNEQGDYIPPHQYNNLRGLVTDDWDSGGRKENSWSTKYYDRKCCPFCEGEGRAFAYFVTNETECHSCLGTRKVQKRRKVEVGTEAFWVECEECNGTGVLSSEMVYFMYLHEVPGKDLAGSCLLENLYVKKSVVLPED